MTDFSRNGALIYFEYADHPHCYGFLFYSGSGVKDCYVDLHGGGWQLKHKKAVCDRFPETPLTTRIDILEQFISRGGCAIIAEYPLGAGLTAMSEHGPNSTHWPEGWVLFAKLVQYIKQQCQPGGLFYGLINQNGIVLNGSSAGSDQIAATVFSPLSQGMITRSPGWQTMLDRNQVLIDHYPKAIVLQAPSLSFVQSDPSRQFTPGFNPALAAVVNPWYYRPRLSLIGTLVQGGTALAAGDILNGTGGSAGKKLSVISAGAPGAMCTVNVHIQASNVATDFGLGETYEKQGSILTTYVVDFATTITCRYGWNEVPLAFKLALSPSTYFPQMTGTDLNRVRTIPIWAACNGNPSVQFHATDPIDAIVPNLYGADDGYDVVALRQRLDAYGGFDLTTYWGEDPALGATSTPQTIINASNTNPIVISTNLEHGVRDGDTVKVAAVTGNLNANGVFIGTTRINPIQFSIPIAGSGAYTGGGRWAFHNAEGNYSIGANWPTQICDWLKSRGFALT
jgi:hypothetical protein